MVAASALTSPSAVVKRLQRLPVMTALGFIIGAATFASGYLPGQWAWFGSVGFSWVFVAFLGGAAQSRCFRAALAGLTMMLGVLLGYYICASFFIGASLSSMDTRFWSYVGAVAGPFFGIVGWGWRTKPGALRALCCSVVASTGLAEAVVLSRIDSSGHIAHITEAAVSLLIPVAFLSSWKYRMTSVLMILPVSVFALVAVGAVFSLYFAIV